MERKIYKQLLEWKENNKKPLMVLGVRQSGKTYIIEEFCNREYENHITINLFEQKNVIELYESNLTSDEKFNRLKLLINFDLEKENTIIFIDEIQESPKLIAELKYYCEKHNEIKIICAGSLLGVKLKRLKESFPVGKVKMLTMYPMDFEEFLMAMDEKMLIDYITDCYKNNKQLASPLHEKALNLYREYMVTGGMPESILNMININRDYIKYDTTILNDILESYFNDMAKYIISENENLKIKRIYNSLPSQLSNNSKKFQFSNIEKNARLRDYETALDWLEASKMVLKSKNVKVPEIPLEGFIEEGIFKLYLSDIGVLCNMLKLNINDILNDNISLYKGVIAENYVANQLVCNGYSLYFWKNEYTSEVDFLIYTKDGIIPIEVKADNNTQSKSLKTYIEKYNPKYSIRISTKDFGYNPKSKIKSVPIYSVFCIK